MSYTNLYGLSTDEFIRLALAEDVGDGDHTSLSTIEDNKDGKAVIKVKEDGIIAGLSLANHILQLVDKTLKTNSEIIEGSFVKNGDIMMTVEGKIRSILMAERLLLNFMQRMSGIATMTRKFVDEVQGTGVRILDTRKTTPNFRQFEKKAVRIGGGGNHRSGLYDMILIKDNHIDASGSISNALMKAKKYLEDTGKDLMIEIETRNLKEVEEVIKTGIADCILLDNFNTDLMREAVKLINNRFETEASGGITLSNVRSYALTGVNFISVGALTHSFKSMDISMKIVV